MFITKLIGLSTAPHYALYSVNCLAPYSKLPASSRHQKPKQKSGDPKIIVVLFQEEKTVTIAKLCFPPQFTKELNQHLGSN